MDTLLNRRPFIEALFDLMNAGMRHHRLEDTDYVLNAIRALRPSVREFDTFEAEIAMKRGQWQAAIHILRNVEAVSPSWLPAKAALVQCLYAIRDPAWRVTGNEILEVAPISEEADMVRIAMGLPIELKDGPAEVAEGPPDPPPAPHTFYVRA